MKQQDNSTIIFFIIIIAYTKCYWKLTSPILGRFGARDRGGAHILAIVLQKEEASVQYTVHSVKFLQGGGGN